MRCTRDTWVNRIPFLYMAETVLASAIHSNCSKAGKWTNSHRVGRGAGRMRKGKGRGPDSGPSSPSTFLRFVSRPIDKVLGADPRAQLRGREEVLPGPGPAQAGEGTQRGRTPANNAGSGRARAGRSRGATGGTALAPRAQSLRRGRLRSPAPSGALSQARRQAALGVPAAAPGPR